MNFTCRISGTRLFSACAVLILLPSSQLLKAQDAPRPVPDSNATPKTDETPVNGRYAVNGQVTAISQSLFSFRSPYEGTNSLRSRNETEVSHTYTLFVGARLSRTLEAFVNPEMARGKGVSEALGLAGYTNGDVIRNPTLGQEPYLGRYFLRYTIPTGHSKENAETVSPGANLIAGTRPKHRLVLTVGKFGTNDLFDTNAYAASTRTQFQNWALINNGAYDYAADTRGYSQGIALEWIHPDWAIRFGSFQMPTVANGTNLANDLVHNRGDQLELELHPRLLTAKAPAIARLLVYRNLAHAGSYRDALALAQQTEQAPDITAVEKRGVVKYGFGLSFEQPLGQGGASGLFVRLGWNDGATESYAYTEIDRTLCMGGQVSGAKWHRPRDRVAAALVQNDLSTAHRDYLAAGGKGFLLGEGRLNYGSERIVEAYYAYQASKLVSLTLDYQLVANPGYNRDRGPASVLSFRAHLEF